MPTDALAADTALVDDDTADGPGRSKSSLEQSLAEQANAAIAKGGDPKIITDRLGVMVKHLRENPDVAAMGSAALARGVDPAWVRSKTWEIANSGTGNINLSTETPSAPGVTSANQPKPSPAVAAPKAVPSVVADASRVGAPPESKGTPLAPDGWSPSGIAAAVARHVVNPALENPLSTVAMMGGGAYTGVPMALQGVKREAEYVGQKAAEQTLPSGLRAIAEADPARISGGEAATTAAMLALPLVAHGAVRAAAPDIGPAFAEAFKGLSAESKGTPPITDAAALDNEILRRDAGIPAANKMATATIPKPEGFRPGLRSDSPLPDDVIADRVGPRPLVKVAPRIGNTVEGLESSEPAEPPSRVRPLRDVQSPADDVQRFAEYDQAVNDAAREHDERAQEELTRQAALRALTGVRRRPGGVAPIDAAATTEAPPIERTAAPPTDLPDVGARPERVPFYTPKVGNAPEVEPSVPERGTASEPPTQEIAGRRQDTPNLADVRTPGEPFAMGDNEGRIPDVPRSQRPKLPRFDPDPTAPVDATPTVDREALRAEHADLSQRSMLARSEVERAPLIARMDEITNQLGQLPPEAPGRRASKALVDTPRYANGARVPPHLVTVDGLVKELVDLEEKRTEAAGRAQYNFVPDENFHTMSDGSSVMTATREGSGPSMQAKAAQNLRDYQRIDEEVTRELRQGRGLSDSHLDELLQRERDARTERNAMADESTAGDSDFDFSEPTAEKPLPRATVLAAESPAGEPTGEPITTNVEKFAPQFHGQVEDALGNAAGRGAEREVVPIAQGIERVKQLAQDIGADPLSIDPRKVGRLSGEEIVAMRSAAQQHMAQIAEWSKMLSNPDLPIEQRTQLDYLIREAKQARDNLIESVSRAASQKGRDLNFLKQMAQHSLDPDVWEAQAKALAGDRVLSDDVIAETRRLAKIAMETCGG